MLGIPKSTNKSNFVINKFTIFLIVIIICLILFILFNSSSIGFFKWNQSINYKELKENLSSFIDINDTQAPSIMEIADVNTLKDKTSIIYSQVENNDILLIYKDKVVIFRPYKNKIVNVFPVNN